MAKLIPQSTANDPLFFFLVLSSDHLSPALGKSPTVTISKNGAAFATPSGAVSEVANGWYQVAGDATDTNTLGDILLHATEASSDNCDLVVAQVVAFNPRAALATPTNITAATGITVATNNDKTGYSLTQAFPSNFSALGISAGGHVSNVDTLTTYTGNTPQTGDSYGLLNGANSVETGYSLMQALRLMFSALCGKASGLATTTATFRDVNDTTNRIVATVDASGDRSAVTLTP